MVKHVDVWLVGLALLVVAAPFVDRARIRAGRDIAYVWPWPAVRELTSASVLRATVDPSTDLDTRTGGELPLPPISMDSRRYVPTEEERVEIDDLIRALAQLHSPSREDSYQYWMTPFVPLADAMPRTIDASRGLDPGFETSPELRRLVELGPKAIPALLARLGDSTPSRLVIGREPRFFDYGLGGIPFRPDGPREAKARGAFPRVLNSRNYGAEAWNLARFGRKHVVTLGDLCFVVLGQIVNRDYHVHHRVWVKEDVVSSPTHDPGIRDAVRCVWESDDPARMLLESLLSDFTMSFRPWSEEGGGPDAERPPFDYYGIRLGAAVRLAFYFPAETRELWLELIEAAGRTASEGARESEWTDPYLRDRASIVSTMAMIGDAAIDEALVRLIGRAEYPLLLRAALCKRIARANEDLVVERIAAALSVPPVLDCAAYWSEHDLLRFAAQALPDRARALFESYVRTSFTRCRCYALWALQDKTARVPWAEEFLVPFLDDKTSPLPPTGERGRYRVCDVALQALVAQIPGLSSTWGSSESERDAEIDSVRRQLAARRR